MLARECGRASAETLANLLQRVHTHHHDALVAHFAEEERLRVLAAGAVPADMAERFHADHAWLNRDSSKNRLLREFSLVVAA